MGAIEAIGRCPRMVGTRRRDAVRIAADLPAESDGGGSRLITETRLSSTGRRTRQIFGLDG